MNKPRPVNLDLTKFKFPITAIVSILHRITGVLMFLSIPLLIYTLEQSLMSPQNFDWLIVTLHTSFLYQLGIWLSLSAASFHIVAGIRHLIMDFGWGESLLAGQRSALAVVIISIITTILAGVWVWV